MWEFSKEYICSDRMALRVGWSVDNCDANAIPARFARLISNYGVLAGLWEEIIS